VFDLVLIVFDWQVLEFRGPASTTPAPTAVGASVALDKVCAAMASMEEPVSLQAYAHMHTFTHAHARRHTHNNDIHHYL
jgi:hypothetical protein